MKGGIVGCKADLFLTKCQDVLLKMLVSAKVFEEAKEHCLQEVASGPIAAICCYLFYL